MLPGLGVLHEDCAHRATLGGLEDLLDRVSVRIDRFRLAVVVEPKDMRNVIAYILSLKGREADKP